MPSNWCLCGDYPLGNMHVLADKAGRWHSAASCFKKENPVSPHTSYSKGCVCDTCVARYHSECREVAPAVAEHYDAGKPQLALLPLEALTEIAKVFEFGANKYKSMHNWRKGMAWLKLANSTLRHVNAWIWGETNDKESGLNHLAHAACDLCFLLTYTATNKGTDDRYKPEV